MEKRSTFSTLLRLLACSAFISLQAHTAASAQPAVEDETVSLAERRLLRIIRMEQGAFQRLQDAGDSLAPMERDRILSEVLSEYQNFVFDNPDYSYGFILYGKLLRRIGDFEAANMAFVRANQIDPNQAVVKQQIGNYLAEEGEFSLALPYFVAAIDLEPEVAVYPFQLGVLLHTYADLIVDRGLLARDALEREMMAALRKAYALEPANTLYLQRYAEAYFDVADPQWEVALKLWQELERRTSDALELDMIRLQRVRVHIALGQGVEAAGLLDQIDRPGLMSEVRELRQSLQP